MPIVHALFWQIGLLPSVVEQQFRCINWTSLALPCFDAYHRAIHAFGTTTLAHYLDLLSQSWWLVSKCACRYCALSIAKRSRKDVAIIALLLVPRICRFVGDCNNRTISQTLLLVDVVCARTLQFTAWTALLPNLLECILAILPLPAHVHGFFARVRVQLVDVFRSVGLRSCIPQDVAVVGFTSSEGGQVYVANELQAIVSKY